MQTFLRKQYKILQQFISILINVQKTALLTVNRLGALNLTIFFCTISLPTEIFNSPYILKSCSEEYSNNQESTDH